MMASRSDLYGFSEGLGLLDHLARWLGGRWEARAGVGEPRTVAMGNVFTNICRRGSSGGKESAIRKIKLRAHAPFTTRFTNQPASYRWRCPADSTLGRTHPKVSPDYGKASKKHIRTALVSCHLASDGVPDVLVTRDESNRRSDRKVVKDLRSLLILDSVLASVKLRNVEFQWAADSVVIKSRSKTVILSKVEKIMYKQGQTCITRNCVGLLRGIADPSEYSDSAMRLAAPELVSNLRRVILHKEILREVSDREPAIRLVVDGHTLN